MRTKGAIVTVLLFFFGFYYHSSAFSKLITDSSQPIFKKIGHQRTKEHDLLTVLSYYMINSFDKDPYLTPSDVIESDDSMIQTLALDLTEGKATETEKSEAIYKWITENIEYDANYYFQVKNQSDFEFDSAVETLRKGKSLCMGFAHLNAALHRAIGIEAKVVYDQEHAWNEVLIDDNWYSHDPTKGAGFIDIRSNKFISQPTMDYFNLPLVIKDGQYLW